MERKEDKQKTMNVENLIDLPETYSALTSDFVHVLQKNDYQALLSYRSSQTGLTSIFASATFASELENRIKTVKNNMDALSAKFITKDSTKANYISKEKISLDTPGFLTQDKMESIISKYPTQYTIDNYASQAKQEANKLADEASDFAAAAMVGINQSGAGASEPLSS